MLNGLFLLNSAAAVAKDPYFPYVTLLLPGNGSNGAQNNTFLDSSTNNFTITRNGNTTQGSFSPYGSYWSNYFDGSGDYLTATSNAAFAFGTGDFTIEAWVNVVSYSGTCSILDTRTSGNEATGVIFYVTATGAISIYNSGTLATSSGTISTNTWTHVAVTRSGTTVTFWINGVSSGTATVSTNFSQQNSYVGTAYNGTSNPFYGYISNLRAVKGTAVYTSAFTPPTTPLTAISGTSLLTCQSNRFIDNSSNAFAITVNGNTSVSRFSPFSPASAYSTTANGGSAYFDGSGDYLTAPDNAALEPGSSDLTWEMWINTSNSTQYATLYSRTTASFASGMWALMMNWASSTSGDLALYVADYSGGTPLLVTTGVNVRDNAWHHIAVVRNGSAWVLYVDGVSRATGTWSGTIVDIAGGPSIGRDEFYTRNYLGFISNLRIVKGTAVYTANFTPPTAPVTAITNTSLLLNATNAAIYDSAMINDLETVGNAQVSTAQSKFGGSSMYFDGSGDYLTAPNSPQFFIGTGNFTIECWFYIAGNSSLNGSNLRVATLLSCLTQSGTLNGYDLSINGNGTTTGTGIFFENYVSGTNYQISYTGTVSQNTWHHVAVVRSGTTTTIYFNGTSVASGTLGNQTISNYSNATVIGRLGYAGYVSEFNGYIDDLRVTNGIARYTSNFTPPTAAFPVQ